MSRRRHRQSQKTNSPSKHTSLFLFFSLVSWILLLALLLLTRPSNPAIIALFLTTLFSALFLTSYALLYHLRRSFLFSGSTILFLILRYFSLGNLLNLFLIGSAALSFEIYLSNRS